MTILTIWTKEGEDAIRIHQLSNDPDDGSAAEQIDHLSSLDAFEGYTCVSDGYTGEFPPTDPRLWRWDGSQVIAAEAQPVPEPTTQQVRTVLQELGMTQEQLDNLFAAAASL